MELKIYQKNVIKDLSRYLELLLEKQSAGAAYTALWNEKNVMVGLNGMPNYNDVLKGVPNVCFKVPTGGGKTFLACNSIKPIFDSMPNMRAKAVVWLVPSDAILSQTLTALSSADHPYRQKLDVEFGSRVEVYSKEQLLNGQNFNPTSVTEQLSVFVLSYDSFRTSKKDGRKAYQENGNLAAFAKYNTNSEVLLEDTDETALIQVVRQLNPVVIVDESHHATSNLSIEMLNNFNPCFVLDLTATPKKGSNIISFVDATALKKENMVKLPVIVYNRKAQTDVFGDAISIRMKLEAAAIKEQEKSGRYIRPIVLFQAQPKVGAESTTFDKIKKQLMDFGIPEEQIAIKTADKNELKNVDLMSPSCPIRFIITVNALKEGWDCPFAYVLATVANKTSSVDVEQILGRVLRLPNTHKNTNQVLNISYVITSSDDFHATLERVVKGLNAAGFSSKDYYAKEADAEPVVSTPSVQLTVDDVQPVDTPDATDTVEDDLPEVDVAGVMAKIEAATKDTETVDPIENDELFATAIAESEAYDAAIENMEPTAKNLAPEEVRDKMSEYRMNDEFAEEASAIEIPQFMQVVGFNMFSETSYELLRPEHLAKGFTLKDKDTVIDFSSVNAEMFRVDVDDGQNPAPKAWRMNANDSAYFKEIFNSQPSEKRLTLCKGMIIKAISKMDCIHDKELQDYIDRVLKSMTEDQIADLEKSPYPYIVKIKEKVKALLAEHAERTFDLWLNQDKIECVPNYKFPSSISPISVTTIIPKSLYTAEEDMNEQEIKLVWELSALDNIKWWHRNISRLGFCINGSINAYPDIIAMTESGRILLIEPKGDHLENDESKLKAKIGDAWSNNTDKRFRYFMVFDKKSPDYPGAYSHDEFMEIVKGL